MHNRGGVGWNKDSIFNPAVLQIFNDMLALWDWLQHQQTQGSKVNCPISF